MKKKRILFINGNLNIGGVEKSLVSILQSIDYSKYDVDLLLLESGGELEAEIPDQVRVIIKNLAPAFGPLKEVVVSSLGQRDKFPLRVRSIFILKKLIGEKAYRLFQPVLKLERYDTCIGFRTGIATDLTVYGIQADKKILWWHHGEINVKDTYGKVAGKSDYLVAVSEYCRQMIIKKFPGLEPKIIVIPNMIDQTVLQNQADEYNPNYENEKTNIVSVGRLSPEKRYDLAVLCAAHLRNKGYDFDWYLIGNGPELSRLKKMVNEYGLTQMFHFVGELSNPYPYISNADLFAHPSYVESQGIAVLEALALNIPVIATDSGGVQEFIVNNQNGFICRKGTEDFFNMMELTVSDKELRENLKRQIRMPIEYSLGAVMLRIKSII